MNALTLTQIWTYPIKSLGGIPLEKAKFNGKGLLLDRRWMLVDDAAGFLTQRVHPQMALFKINVEGEEMIVTFKKHSTDYGSIRFNIHELNHDRPIKASIWGDEVIVHEVSEDVSRWFSEQLHISCRLVKFPEENPRPVEANEHVYNEHVSLADAFPFLMIGQSSLDDLNSRLEAPVPMNRFRPNFVFNGGSPYEEDNWQNFAIGNYEFVGIRRCARCTVPAVNQETGERGTEPVRTLARYRNWDNKVFFGQNVIARGAGEVAIGDKILLRSDKI